MAGGLGPDLWRWLGLLMGGGGLLAQVSLLQTVATLSAAGVLTSAALGVKWLIENRQKIKEARQQTQQKTRKDALTEWQEYAQKLEGNVTRLEGELAESRKEVVKASGLVSSARIRLQTYRGRIALLIQALGLQREGTDPLVIQQMAMQAQAVLVTKPDGTITEAAPNIIAIIDYDQSELVNMNVERLIPRRFRDKHKAFMDRARDLSIPLSHKDILPLIFRTKGGQEQPVNLRVRRTEEGGKVIRFSALVMERDESPDDGNGGSQSGDSGAFLKAGAPEASRATAEMTTLGGAGSAKGEGTKGD